MRSQESTSRGNAIDDAFKAQVLRSEIVFPLSRIRKHIVWSTIPPDSEVTSFNYEKEQVEQSSKSEKSFSKKITQEQCQTMSRKTVARGTQSKSSMISKKSSPRALSLSTPKPGSPPKPLKDEIRKRAGGARSKTVDKRQAQLEKGRALRQLSEQGYSRQGLTRKFRCSESLVRELVILGGLPKDLEEAYLQKKLNRKEVLGETRARKNPDKPPVSITSEIPSDRGRPSQFSARTGNSYHRRKDTAEFLGPDGRRRTSGKDLRVCRHNR